MMIAKRQKSERFGRDAEAVAAAWFEAKGWLILGQRIKTKRGEVDLIVSRSGVLAFVEVKARASQSDLALAIDNRRLARVAAAAELLLDDYGSDAESVQIDVLLLAPGVEPVHLSNVWHEGME